MTAIEAAERLAQHENLWGRIGLSARTITYLREALALASSIDMEDPRSIGELQAKAKIARIYLDVDLEGVKS
ncbi:hypothetical protein AWV80_01305 [Cupriavidus sp. UYMU48A]|nr:hypothetical protein AWV80_01305 [Cupriavidus sp. UYMU48A]